MLTKTTATEKAFVMIAHDLGMEVEAIAKFGTDNRWLPAGRPSWDWDHYEFRIAKHEKPKTAEEAIIAIRDAVENQRHALARLDVPRDVRDAVLWIIDDYRPRRITANG